MLTVALGSVFASALVCLNFPFCRAAVPGGGYLNTCEIFLGPWVEVLSNPGVFLFCCADGS